MFAGRPDVDVPAFSIFEAQPRNGPKQGVEIPHARKHGSFRGVRIEETDVENLCAHSAALLLDSFEGEADGHFFFDLTRAPHERNNVPWSYTICMYSTIGWHTAG